MAASVSSAFTPSGPSHSQAPKEFGGGKDNFEQFSFTLKAFRSLMTTASKKAMDKVDENLVLEVIEEYFNDAEGSPRADLLEMAPRLQRVLVTLCTLPASTFLRR